MFNLRDLIYGTQEDVGTQEEVEEAELEHLRAYGPFYGSKPHISHPKPQTAKSILQRRAYVPTDYMDGPELLAENKDIPHFLTEHPAYFRFPQEEKKLPRLRRETLRQLWDQACFGGDFDSAVKILMVMSDRSSVEFSDFYKFVILLRDQPDISTAHLRGLAKTAIRSKLPPSSKTETAKALLDMFIQLFVAEGEISEAYEMLTQYISHPVMAQEPSLTASLAILSCLETIRFVHQTKPSVLQLLQDKGGKVTEKINKAGISDSDSSDSDSSDSEGASSSEIDSDTEGVPKNDIPPLEASHVTSALLCPSCDDIVLNPFQFFSSVQLLQQFAKIHTSKYINQIGGPEIKRVLQRCCNNLMAAVEGSGNIQCFDLYALCSSMLEATGKPHQAHGIMKKMLLAHPHNHRVRRLYIQYLCMFKRARRRTLLVSSLRLWLGRGNGMLERSVEAKVEASAATAPDHRMFRREEGEGGYSSEDEDDEEEVREVSIDEPVNVCDGDSEGRSGRVYDRSLEELQCGLLMQQLGCLSHQDVLTLCCDVLEARPPVIQVLSRPRASSRRSQREREFESGFSEVHLSLWRELASLLGPLPSKAAMEDALSCAPTAEIIHSTAQLLPRALQSGVAYAKKNTLEREEARGGGDRDGEKRGQDPAAVDKTAALPLTLPLEHFTTMPLKSLASKNFNYVHMDVETHNSSGDTIAMTLKYFNDDNEEVDPPSPAPSAAITATAATAVATVSSISTGAKRAKVSRELTTDSSSRPSSISLQNDLVNHFRRTRHRWLDNECMFPTHYLGEGYSETVLECTAKDIIREALEACNALEPRQENGQESTQKRKRTRKDGDTEASGGSGSACAEKFFPTVKLGFEEECGKKGSGTYSVLLSKDDTVVAHQKYTNAFVQKCTAAATDLDDSGASMGGSCNSDRRAQLWNMLEDLCAEGSGAFSFHPEKKSARQSTDPERGTSYRLSPFSVQKVTGCINTTSPLWLDMEKKQSIFRVGQGQDKTKHFFYRVGDQLLELLCYMAIVKSHLSGEADGLFVAKVAQLLIEQSERDIVDSESKSEGLPQRNFSSTSSSTSCSSHISSKSTIATTSQRCISYLEGMNINLLRAVRVANVLVANEVNPQVAPLVTCTLPADEALLLSSATLLGKKRVARTYRPI